MREGGGGIWISADQCYIGDRYNDISITRGTGVSKFQKKSVT